MLAKLDSLVAVIGAVVYNPVAVTVRQHDLAASVAIHNAVSEVLCIVSVTAAGGEKTVNKGLQLVVVLEYVAVLLFGEVSRADVDMEAAGLVDRRANLAEGLCHLFEAGETVRRLEDWRNDLICVCTVERTVADNLVVGHVVAVCVIVVHLCEDAYALCGDGLQQVGARGVDALNLHAECVSEDVTGDADGGGAGEAKDEEGLALKKAEGEKARNLLGTGGIGLLDILNLLIEGLLINEGETVGEIGVTHKIGAHCTAGSAGMWPMMIAGGRPSSLATRLDYECKGTLLIKHLQTFLVKSFILSKHLTCVKVLRK